MNTITSFDLLGPLPTGTTLLEASAGTGKTYTIAALATRYIAEGVTTIDRMLVITFGRNATRELRERVREALTAARDALRGASVGPDPVTEHLLSLPDAARQAASERLSRAVADFDSGTIATTHQFCDHALKALGLHADTHPGETFVENISELIDEVVDDFYLRKYTNAPPGQPRIPYAQARRIAREAVNDPQAALDAGPVEPGSLEAARVSFAQAVRAEVLRRRQARRLVTFDDLVMRLQQTVTDADSGEVACRRLRDAYQVVLVDEFQDTDPGQWDILRRVFHDWRTLILIGDPKQAIYAFRGADVFSYLDAADHARTHATLPTNYRSDAAVVSGVRAIIGGLQLGDPRITVHPVNAAHKHARISGFGHDARTRLRVLNPEEVPGVGKARTAVARDVAADIVALLTGPARLHGVPVAPGDIAVLVGTHAQGALIQQALARVNVPAVVNSNASVFVAPAAREWSILLTAMQRPRGSALRDAALTDFFGYTAKEVALHPEAVDLDVSERLRRWLHVLDAGSVAELVSLIETEQNLAARVLSRPDGERHLTDLRHIAGVLHAHQRRTRTRTVALSDWLFEQIQRGEQGDSTVELVRRLETDAEAVQVLTIHASKGLEFPIVYVPFGWDRGAPAKDALLTCHDGRGRRVLDVRGEDAIDREPLVEASDREDADESMRLLYVAMTRASSLLVLHWAASKQNTRRGPLHRALTAQLRGAIAPAQEYPAHDPPVILSPWVNVETVPALPSSVRWTPEAAAPGVLSAAQFTRQIDGRWRRTSYSGLTRAVHESERAPSGFHEDEPDDSADGTVEATGVSGLASPFADLPAGAAFGTLVHAVLETVDTDAVDLPAELQHRSAQQLTTHPVADVTPTALAQALLPSLQTPMGALADGQTLAQFSPRDRLTELDFELPMGSAGVCTLADVGAILRTYLPPDDPLATYADRIDASGLGEATLLGSLSGSIDAVLRTPSQRFLVVDYKTNLLRDPARPGAESLVEGYRAQALAAAMMDAHYPLQALLYSAALHRYLRWRLRDYDPTHHLGGVLYLFVRGMAGRPTPPGCGVFSWRPPSEAIAALSDLLDGRRR